MQHDYIIDNQTSASLRSDLNNALAAIVSQNSGATAPATTYANQFWYDTSTDTLKQRNETNTVWISLGTVDQTNNKFEPNQTFATQAEAEVGTDNTKAMTALRTAQAIAALTPPSGGLTLLGTLTTTSGSTQTLSSLVLTSYKQLLFMYNSVRCNNSTIHRVGSASINGSTLSGNTYVKAKVLVSLVDGYAYPQLAISGSSATGAFVWWDAGSAVPYAYQVEQTGYTTATTSVSVSVSSGNFNAGSVVVYGVK